MTITMATQCRKDYVEPPKYDFRELVSLSPAKKIYSVNDTIFLTFKTNTKTLFDTMSNQRLQSTVIKFIFGATLLPKYSTPTNPSGGFCNFIIPSGVSANYNFSQSGTSAYFQVGCDNSSGYDVRIGIILKYQGIYVLDLPDKILLEPCSGQTNPYLSSGLQFTYNLLDCNKDIYLSIPTADRKEFPVGYTEKQIDLKVSYAFKVQ
jgi:hypothetical protein